MNKKSYSFDMETFRSMFQMCLRLPRQQFVYPSFEKDILNFMRELGYPGNIKLLSDVKVDTLPQPWGTFGTIINKCLSDVALTEAEQIKLATKRSLIQTHISHASGSGAHKGTDVTPGVTDVPTYDSDEEQLSWKSSDEDDDDDDDDDDEVNVEKDEAADEQDDDEVNASEHEDDDDDERTESNNDGDEFVHPKFITHDDEATHEEDVNEEDNFDPRVHTPSRVESTDDEDNDDEIQGANIEGEKMDEW
ncbi:hypothetical protein Tco_0939638 [Tanacetum coccineum]|uniref:Uncharacterized protein n=1 Tax=Tanacetum coccineum TaxID=301880 RepID=A0ABQ5DLI9_9ASTR